MSDSLYWLWLSSETSVSPKSLNALIRHYGSARNAFFAPQGEFSGVEGISASDAKKLEARSFDKAEKIIKQCSEKNISFVTIDSPAYPKCLMSVFAPPPVLYYYGSLPQIDTLPSIAVVGTRKADDYGIRMARKLSYELASAGVTVVSGLTKGIDVSAAEGALYAGGFVIGVLGTAISAASGATAEKLKDSGLILSEYPPGTPSQRQYFRARNRITAGISVGTLAVEAPVESGTSLFVAEALEQGKDIFAVPGNADSELSSGTLKMIREGAKPVITANDIVCDYASRYRCLKLLPDNFYVPRDLLDGKAPIAAPSGKRTAEKAQSKAVVQPSEINVYTAFPNLSETQYTILKSIKTEGSLTDEIVYSSGLSMRELLPQLTVLEIKGAVRREPGNRFIINTAKARN